jgi:hypothetical protein
MREGIYEKGEAEGVGEKDKFLVRTSIKLDSKLLSVYTSARRIRKLEDGQRRQTYLPYIGTLLSHSSQKLDPFHPFISTEASLARKIVHVCY